MSNGPGDYWTDMGCDDEVRVPSMDVHSAGFRGPCGFVVWPDREETPPKSTLKRVSKSNARKCTT